MVLISNIKSLCYFFPYTPLKEYIHAFTQQHHYVGCCTVSQPPLSVQCNKIYSFSRSILADSLGNKKHHRAHLSPKQCPTTYTHTLTHTHTCHGNTISNSWPTQRTQWNSTFKNSTPHHAMPRPPTQPSFITSATTSTTTTIQLQLHCSVSNFTWQFHKWQPKRKRVKFERLPTTLGHNEFQIEPVSVFFARVKY